MDFDTLQALDKLLTKVEAREYEDHKSDEWQNYEVKVCPREDESTRRWRMVPPDNKLDFHHKSPQRRLVTTRYASAIAWLFDEIKKIHQHESDRHSYHDLYADLADEANLYIEKNKSGEF